MPAPTSSAATRRPRARSRRCSGRPTSRSVPTARCTSATGSTRASAAIRISTTRPSGRDLPDCPEGFRAEGPGLRRRDDRRPDHRAAIAGGQRPRDRVRRAEGARRVGGERRRGAAERSESVHARPRDLPLYQLGPEGQQRAGDAGVVRRSGAAHRGLPRHAARGSRRHAGRRAARARRRRRRPARSGAVDARPARRRVARTSWSTSRAASTGRIAAISKRWAPARPERSRRSTIGCAAILA